MALSHSQKRVCLFDLHDVFISIHIHALKYLYVNEDIPVFSDVKALAFIAYCSPTVELLFPLDYELAGNEPILMVCYLILGMMQINIIILVSIMV